MRVYCYNTNWSDPRYTKFIPKITIGKFYEVIEERGRNYFLIVNDKGEKQVYARTCFQYIHQMREAKLNDLGI